MTRSNARLAAIGLAVAAAYFSAAHLGFRLAFVAEQVSTVWAPTGIAQAALILWGRSLWPAIWIAAFTANASASAPLGMAAAIASGNTLEAVLTAWVLSRFFAFDPSLRRTRSVVAFVVVGGILSTVVSATIGVASLCAAGQQPWHRFWQIWPDWWLGDTVGALVVGPVILTLASTPGRGTLRQWLETVLLIVGAVAAAEIVFGQIFGPSIGGRPLEFVLFPFVIAAAVRLSQPATSLIVLCASIVTIAHTLEGVGPFSGGEVHRSLVHLQVFMGVLAGTGLVLAAAMSEWRTSERRRAAAHAVSDLLTTADSVEGSAADIVRAICENLEWPHGALWLVDRDLSCLRSVTVRGGTSPAALAFTKASAEIRFARGVGLPGRVWASGAPVWIPNVVVDPNFPRAPFAQEAGYRSAFGFPILIGSEFTGVIECFSPYVVAPDLDLLNTMSIVGSQIGQFIARKRVETAAIEAERHTRAILDSALDPIVGMDHRGTITEFNPAAERTFGYRREDVIGGDLAQLLVPPRLRDRYRAAIAEYVRSSPTTLAARVEALGWHAEGREFPVEVAVTKSAHEDPPRFTGFVRDLTSRMEAERERELLLQRELTARREAEAANRAKDEFLATLSHELRTPLNAIVGWTRMLLDHALDEPSTRHALEIIDRNAHLQVQLVADILDVSRIITGGLRLDLRPVDLGSVIGAALDAVRPAADARRIRLRSRLPPTIPLTEGDPQRLQQIVWNLLANAVKFTPPGGQVDVDLFDPGGERLCIRVQDNGDGIDPHFLPHVFERFRQADGSTSREHGGLGLGLAIVRHLVELHGGSVYAQSPGRSQGSTFLVELPKTDVGMDWYVQRPFDNAQGRAFDRVKRLPIDRPLTLRDAASRPLLGCTALVVDDDADARELLMTALSTAGAEVRTAASVSEALSSAEERWPDVLLADIGLPGEDGYALIRELRTREPRQRPLAAAAITAYARERDRDHALASGFDQHFAKPVDPAAVVDAVRSMWAVGHRERQI